MIRFDLVKIQRGKGNFDNTLSGFGAIAMIPEWRADPISQLSSSKLFRDGQSDRSNQHFV